MALRTKSLIFFTKLDADVADSTLTALDQITIYAKNSTRTFRSCTVEIGFADKITVTGGTITEYRVAASVAAAAATTFTDTNDLTHTSENISGVLGPFDFTAHFAANFPAADSTTLDISVYFAQSTGTTLGMSNVNAKITLTYEYDDTGLTTDFKTAIIPLESLVGALGTTEAEIGSNQIPQLTGTGGLLENVASVAVRQQSFEIEGNDNAASATDYVVNLRIDSGTTKTFTSTEMALQTDSRKRFVYSEAPDPTAVHAFKLWSTGAGRLGHCAILMYVTYEFTISGTTETLISIQPLMSDGGPVGGTTAGNKTRLRLQFFVEEPATITLKQSGVRVTYSDSASVTGISVAVGAQATRAYTDNCSVVAGGQALTQRIDSGGAQGAGITLARGWNTLLVDVFRTATVQLGRGIAVTLFLNYKAAVHADGEGVHAHTTYWLNREYSALLTTNANVVYTPTAPNIPETVYRVVAIGLMGRFFDPANSIVKFQAQRAAGEGEADGWESLLELYPKRDGVLGELPVFSDMTPKFKRFPTDPDANRLGLETSRQWWGTSDTNRQFGALTMLTYHAMSFAVAGTISNSAGGTVTIYAYRNDTGELIGSTTRSGNGAYSIPWYDSTLMLNVVAYEDSTHKSVSAQGVGGATFDFDLGRRLVTHPGMAGGMRG